MMAFKIIFILLTAGLAIIGCFSSKPENLKIVYYFIAGIILTTFISIILEIKSSNDENQKQKKAEDAYKQIENLNTQNNELISQNNELKGRMIDFQTLNTLMPGKEPDPNVEIRHQPPENSIKIYLGSVLAWWNSNTQHTYTLVSINKETALKLSIDANNGLLISGKIRRNDGTEVVNLIDNKYIRVPTVHIEPKRINENELIILGNTGEKLLHINFLNEKAIYIEGTFYDSKGKLVLNIKDNEIVDMSNNRFLPGASFGQVENLFTYNTFLKPYHLEITIVKPSLIDKRYRIDYMHEGKIIEKPSEATIIVSNMGTEPIRIGNGFDGEIAVDISGQVIDLKISPQMSMSDYIEWNGKTLRFSSLIINPMETKTINVLMQDEGEIEVHATLKGEEIIPKNK